MKLQQDLREFVALLNSHEAEFLDLLTSVSGVEFEDAWSSRVQAELDGLPVCFLGWRSLIENKEASGRPKDLADVAKLKAVAAARRPPG